MIGYALLGATWLVMKTEGELRDRAYHLSWLLLVAMLCAIGIVSIATPFLHVQYTHRWFAWPNIILTAPVPIAVAAVTVLLLRSLANKYDYQPFFLTLALFALSYAGLGISMYPYIVPQSITIWQAASPENSQLFMLFGVADPDTADPRLYRLGLLGVPRQGQSRTAAIIDDQSVFQRSGPRFASRKRVNRSRRADTAAIDAAPAVVCRALARRRRHGDADLLRPAALDRAEMSHLSQSAAIVRSENRSHSSKIPAPLP